MFAFRKILSGITIVHLKQGLVSRLNHMLSLTMAVNAWGQQRGDLLRA